ncbi:MAG: HD domain-containing protein [Candidatus Methanoperedens sp.]|nr:HD domain-containing protein [Candidatus Methanoperedens sp.]
MEIRDAIYGDIELLPGEVKLLDTFEMQRLRKIKQLALVHLVYPTAVHTRFDHSIGVRHCVNTILERSHIQLSLDEKELLFKAALLHDIGHACFSHITEELDDVPKHTKFLELMINGDYKDLVIENHILTKQEASKTLFVADVLKRDEADDIKKIVTKSQEYEKNYLAEFLNGYIDADNLDYIRRDGYFLGLSYGNYDDRIYSSFRLIQTETGKKVTFSDGKDSISSLLTVLRARYELYRAAFRHHTVLVADAMLHCALEAWTRDNSDLLFILGDEELLYEMRKSDKARDMITRLQSRRLYKRAYSINKKSPPDIITKAENILGKPEKQTEFLRELTTKAKVQYDDILFNQNRRDVWKDYGKIAIGIEKPYELNIVAQNELETLKKMYELILDISIYVSDPYIAIKINEICRDIFGYKGEFQPKTAIAPVFYDTISQILNEIRSEKKASLKILNQLYSDKKTSADEIGRTLEISRSTSSHYLTYLKEKFKEKGIDLIKSKRINYKKFWWIGDPSVFDKVKGEIKEYAY